MPVSRCILDACLWHTLLSLIFHQGLRMRAATLLDSHTPETHISVGKWELSPTAHLGFKNDYVSHIFYITIISSFTAKTAKEILWQHGSTICILYI